MRAARSMTAGLRKEKEEQRKMSTDSLITAEELAGRLKMAAEGIKKKPGLMKSTVGSMELVRKYVERIVTAKDKGKWVATHGTQQPLEIYEAMDVVGSVASRSWRSTRSMATRRERR
jgi:hypothetical protein